MSEVELLKRIEKLEKWIERRSSKDQIPSSIVTTWIQDTDPWVYAGATSFTIVGKDRTSTFKTGVTKVKYYDGGSDYGTVTASVYSGGNTTVYLVPNNDYSIADPGGSHILTNCFYSFGTPADFPAAFNYTPTGISATNVTLSGRFNIIGGRKFVDFLAVFAGAITFTTMPSLPIAASPSYKGYVVAQIAVSGTAGYYDAGTAYKPGALYPTVLANGSTFMLVDASGTQISATSPITWAVSDGIEAHFSYE